MNLTHYYYYFKKAIPERICDDIVRYGKSLKDQMAITGGYDKKEQLNKNQIKDLKTKRDSDVVWISERWIYKEIHPYINQANRDAGWNFKWDFLKLVNLLNITKVNIIIGIVTVGINLIKNKEKILVMEKLENCL